MNKYFFKVFTGFVLLVTLSADAQQLDWAYQLGNQTSDSPGRLLTDEEGNVYEYGFFSDSLDFDPGPQVRGIRSNGYVDTYVRKFNPAGTLLWVKRVGGTSNDTPSSAALDTEGNLYLSVKYSGQVDFDPGPGTYTLNYKNALLKLDKNGNFLTVFDLGNVSTLGIAAILINEQGEIYIGGSFRNGQDFDPGAGTFYMSPIPGINTPPDAFLIKISADGNLIWGKKWGKTYSDYVLSMGLDLAGNIVTSGFFELDVDFDPGPAAMVLEATATDRFISKFDPDGNFLWAKQLDAPGTGGFKIDPNGNLIIGGEFSGTIDFDPGPEVYLLSSHNSYLDFYLAKLDADGNFLWAKGYGGLGQEYQETLDIDELGNIYSTGSYQLTADFDPGPGVLNQGSNHDAGFILKSDFLGNTLWVRTFSGGANYAYNVRVAKNGSLFVTGEFNSDVNLNPNGAPSAYFISYGDYDAFLMKLKQNHIYTGFVYNDLNNNGLRDNGEAALKGVRIVASNAGHHTITNEAGQFYFYTNLLGDTIRPSVSWPGWSAQPAFALPSAAQAPMNFALHSTFPQTPDVAITMVELTPFRPGFETEVHIQVNNLGTKPLVDIPIELKITSPFQPQLLDSSIPVQLQNANLMQWNISQLPIYSSVLIKVRFKTPTSVSNNLPIQLDGSALLAEDVYQTNNLSSIETQVVGSFDPNDKQVTPSVLEQTALDTTNLRYVIRFQNTGTYRADFVVILDTLPTSLDLSTLQVLGASHPFTWRLVGARVLEFRFDPIHLPDSTTNEPESHGFVAFSIQPKPGLPLGTSILNRAGIYFDYNAPIITNYSQAQVLETLAANDPESPEAIDFLIQPNPLDHKKQLAIILSPDMLLPAQATIVDQNGRSLQTFVLNNRMNDCRLNDLPPGAYFVQVQAGGRMMGKLLIIQ